MNQISEQTAGRRISTILCAIIEHNFACVTSCRDCRLLEELLTSAMKLYDYNKVGRKNMNVRETWEFYFQERSLSKKRRGKVKFWPPNSTWGRSEGAALYIRFREGTNKTIMWSFNDMKVKAYWTAILEANVHIASGLEVRSTADSGSVTYTITFFFFNILLTSHLNIFIP